MSSSTNENRVAVKIKLFFIDRNSTAPVFLTSSATEPPSANILNRI